MSLFGALNSGVSGLSAQAAAMGVISDNIANSSSHGYKGTVSRFSTLVTSAATNNSYTPGGVNMHPHTLINQQGLIPIDQKFHLRGDFRLRFLYRVFGHKPRYHR